MPSNLGKFTIFKWKVEEGNIYILNMYIYSILKVAILKIKWIDNECIKTVDQTTMWMREILHRVCIYLAF